MDLKDLEAFLQIARFGSLSKAAAALQRSQPTMSLRLKAVESVVGGPVFVRTSRGMELTPAGLALLPFAERISELFSAGIVSAGSELGRSRLTVATIESVANTVAADLLERLSRELPRLEVSMLTAYSYQIIQMVIEGAANVGLVLGNEDHAGLRAVEIIREQVRFYVQANHPLLTQAPCRLADLVHTPVVLSPWRPDWRDCVKTLVELAEGRVRFWDVSPALVVKHLMRLGWVGLISRFHVEEDLRAGDLVQLPVSDLPSHEFIVSVLVRNRKLLDPALICFLQCVALRFPHSAQTFSRLLPNSVRAVIEDKSPSRNVFDRRLSN
jgi:DNA-binding transcriptional LysR family regulator